MAFSQEVIRQAWERAGGRCECQRVSCGRHLGRCNKQLVWGNHADGQRGAWEAHHKTAVSSGGGDVLSNCEILCLECHRRTKSYGRH